MLNIKLDTKQIKNLHILYDNLRKYNKRFNGYKLLPSALDDKTYDVFESSIIEYINNSGHDGNVYTNALSYFGIYPDEYDQNLKVAKEIIGVYGSELKDRPIVEVGSGNFPALSLKIAQLYPEVNNIIVYDNDLIVNKKEDVNEVFELEKMDIRRDCFDSSREVPKNSIIISRHPCTAMPGIIANRHKNLYRNIDLYTVLCNCSNNDINLDYYDFDDILIRPSINSNFPHDSLDRMIAQNLFKKELLGIDGNPVGWQDNLEEYFKYDKDYHFTTTTDPLSKSKYKVMYTKRR